MAFTAAQEQRIRELIDEHLAESGRIAGLEHRIRRLSRFAEWSRADATPEGVARTGRYEGRIAEAEAELAPLLARRDAREERARLTPDLPPLREGEPLE